MKLILILAVLSLLFLPVLAVEPVYLGGTFGKNWLNSSANMNPSLWTWGSPSYSSYYFTNYGGLPYYPYPGIYPYSKFIGYSPYGEWIPYTLYSPNDFYSSGYAYNYVNPPLL